MVSEVVIKGVNIATLCILYVWVSIDIIVSDKRKNRVKCCIILTGIVVVCELGCYFTDNTSVHNRLLSILFNTIGFTIAPYIMLVEGEIYSKEDVQINKKIFILAVVNSILAVLSPFTGWIFYVSPSNIYSRGDLFFFYIGTLIFYVLYSIVKKAVAIKDYPYYFRKMIVSSGVFLIIAMMIQTFYPYYHTTWISISICLVFYYAFSCEASSMIDGLTGLLNRTAYDNHIRYLDKSEDGETAILMIDINNFKMINDTKGHAYGDVCLKEVAGVLKETFCYKCQVFRYGGDEFVVIAQVECLEDLEEYRYYLDCLLKEKHEENEDFPTVSVGYAIYDVKKDVEDVVNLADRNMYRNKINSSENV